jgi:hypothetical protein
MVVLCRKVGPRFFLPGICAAWGAVIIGFGYTKNWQSLVPLRLVLGLLESGYFPGCVYLLSCWYTKCKLNASLVRRRPWDSYMHSMLDNAMIGRRKEFSIFIYVFQFNIG